MTEKDWEHRLAQILRQAMLDPSDLRTLPITSSTNDAVSLYDLWVTRFSTCFKTRATGIRTRSRRSWSTWPEASPLTL
jgi:hypothetical protein